MDQDSYSIFGNLDYEASDHLTLTGGCDLFQWIVTPHAARIHEQLAQQGIFTRLFQEPMSLRFGLPGNDMQWQRLDAALVHVHVHETDEAGS